MVFFQISSRPTEKNVPKFIAPSIELTAFNCPHCGVLTSQAWFSAYAEPIKNREAPMVWTEEKAEKFDWSAFDGVEDEDEKAFWKKRLKGLSNGQPKLYRMSKSEYLNYCIDNVNLSRCMECSKPTIWVHENIIYPNSGEVAPPNPDLPDDIARDYLEAASILHLSPRGAAALLRLCLQKLCVEIGRLDPEIGMTGDNINTNIALLVKAGLSSHIQQALDTVRVVGNESVHPGEMDIRDSTQTAAALFSLINMVADRMLSEPKRIQEFYQALPERKRDHIEKRDGSKAKT